MVIALVASKVDDSERAQVNIKTASEYAKKIGAQFYQTSAKDGTGIQPLFTSIGERLHL